MYSKFTSCVQGVWILKIFECLTILKIVIVEIKHPKVKFSKTDKLGLIAQVFLRVWYLYGKRKEKLDQEKLDQEKFVEDSLFKNLK